MRISQAGQICISVLLSSISSKNDMFVIHMAQQKSTCPQYFTKLSV